MLKKKAAPLHGSDLFPCYLPHIHCRTSRKTSKHNPPSLCPLIWKEKASKLFQYVFPLTAGWGLISRSQFTCSRQVLNVQNF